MGMNGIEKSRGENIISCRGKKAKGTRGGEKEEAVGLVLDHVVEQIGRN